jgi:hypothetical protein
MLLERPPTVLDLAETIAVRPSECRPLLLQASTTIPSYPHCHRQPLTIDHLASSRQRQLTATTTPILADLSSRSPLPLVPLVPAMLVRANPGREMASNSSVTSPSLTLTPRPSPRGHLQLCRQALATAAHPTRLYSPLLTRSSLPHPLIWRQSLDEEAQSSSSRASRTERAVTCIFD